MSTRDACEDSSLRERMSVEPRLRHKVLARGGWGNWPVSPSQQRGITPEVDKGSSPGEQTSGSRRPKGRANGLGYGRKPPFAFRSLHEVCEQCLALDTRSVSDS